jgi:hypothetical protein
MTEFILHILPSAPRGLVISLCPDIKQQKRCESRNHSESFGLYIILSLETFTSKNYEDSAYSIRTRIYSKISSYGYLEQDSEIFYQRAGVEVRIGAGK